MGLAPSRRSPQQSIADRTTYVDQLAVEVMLQHDERQRLLAIAERSLWKPLAYIGRPTYVSVRTSWLFLLGTPRGYPRNAPLHGHRPAASSCMNAENWALSIWMVSGKQASMAGGLLRNNLSCNEQTSIRVWMLVCLCSPQTQCTGTVRIIAPLSNAKG